nr:phage antirepressor [uncultured Prevotella sp.]
MNEIQIFENKEFGSVRVVGNADNPYFCAADVCKALGYSNGRDAIARHVEMEDVVKRDTLTVKGNQLITYVNESGLYALIFGSKLPSAKKFKNWVTSEVLPAIRKHGAYMTTDTIEKILQSPELVIGLATELKNEREKNRLLVAKSEYLDVILGSKEAVTTAQIAQDYGMSAVAFNRKLRDLRIQRMVNGQWILRFPYYTRDFIQSKTILIHHNDGRTSVKMLTLWTQEGRKFLYKTLKDQGILPKVEQSEYKEKTQDE